MGLSDKVKYELKRHFSDASAIATSITPIYAFIETQVAQMSNQISINARLLCIAGNYLGISSFLKLRDYSMKRWKITSESSESTKYIHDTAIILTPILFVKPILYLVAGETDWEKIAFGTAGALAIKGLIGGPLLHFVDIYRELTGVKESERTPELLKRQSNKTKKLIAAGLLAASMVSTVAYYHITKDSSRNTVSSQSTIEKIVEQEHK